MKICTKCKITKDITNFGKSKYSKDGHKIYCKECARLDQKKYREENKDKIKASSIEYREKNKDKIKIYLKSEKRKESKKRYYESNKDKVCKKSTEYYNNNKESVSKRNKSYRSTNNYKEKRGIYLKEWSKSNKHILVWRRLVYRVLSYLGKNKEYETILYLGYSANDLKIHIENLFQEGMTWDNHGEWHIDHIRPISSFEKDTEPSEVNSLSNLRPIWASENMSKGSKYDIYATS
jgi:hypothetical protein